MSSNNEIPTSSPLDWINQEAWDAMTAENKRKAVQFSHKNSPALHVFELATAHWKSAVVYALAKYSVAEVIQKKGGSASSKEIAEDLGLDEDILYRSLRAASSEDLVVEQADRYFRLTASGETLLEDHPHSSKKTVLLEAGRVHRTLWIEFDALFKDPTLKSQKVAYGIDNYWEMFDKIPGHMEVFIGGMSSNSKMQGTAILDVVEFKDGESFVDLAGGAGQFTFIFLEKYAASKGIVVDLERTVKTATVPDNLRDRCVFKPFDLFDAASYPAGHDTYFLKQVLHDWSDKDCVQILKNAAACLSQDKGRVFIADPEVPPANVRGNAKFFDLHMRSVLLARERTEAEFADLARQAGLKLIATHQTNAGISVFEMVPTDRL